MKVKISYTVDLDSVPDLIKDLLEKNKNDLLEAVRLTEEVIGSDLDVESYKNIINACNQIDATKSVYEDCYSLLGSYIKTIADINIPSNQNPAPQEQSILDNINKINELTETLNNRQAKEQNSEHD